MTRSVALVLSMCALALAVASCGGSDDSSSGEEGAAGGRVAGEISLLTTAQQKAGYDQLIANFEKKYPDAKVKVTYNQPLEVATNLRTQLASGNAPDVFWSVPGSILVSSTQPLAKAGFLADLSGSPWADRVSKYATEKVTFDGKLIAWPTDIGSIVLAWNPKVASEVGLDQAPATFPQLLEDCQTARAAGKPFMVFDAQADTKFAGALAAIFVYGEDPDWMKKRADGSETFSSSPLWRTTLQRIVDMKEAGCFQENPQGTAQTAAIQQFTQGRAVTIPVFATLVPQLEQLMNGAKVEMVPIPADTEEGTRMVLTVANALAVWAKTDNPTTAKAFVDFAAQPDQNRAFAEANNVIAIDDAEKDEFPAQFDSFEPLYSSGRLTTNAQNDFQNPEVFTSALIPGVTGLFTGQKTVGQVLKDMDAAWEKGPAS